MWRESWQRIGDHPWNREDHADVAECVRDEQPDESLVKRLGLQPGDQEHLQDHCPHNQAQGELQTKDRLRAHD